MNTRLLLLVFFLSIFPLQNAMSQNSGLNHEFGIIVGPLAFYSDFGERYDYDTNTGNTGIGVGLVYFLNYTFRDDAGYSIGRQYIHEHFKLRGELDYHKTSLEHFGQWVADDKTSLFADQLRAMSGSTSVFDVGAQIEYFPLSLRRFEYMDNKFAPFISVGIHFSYFDPEVKSSFGPLNSPVSTPDKYYDSFQQDSGTAFSLVASAGLRYKLSVQNDLLLDFRWQNYFSDWVDGLNPDVVENKANDWLFWVNIGYVYYLDSEYNSKN